MKTPKKKKEKEQEKTDLAFIFSYKYHSYNHHLFHIRNLELNVLKENHTRSSGALKAIEFPQI